jgi:hypothetical protein
VGSTESGDSRRSEALAHSPGASGGAVWGSEPRDDSSAQEPSHDSCFDELNLLLSQSIQQPDPDPNLQSPSEAIEQRAGRTDPASLFRPDRARPPRTSEVFRSVGPRISETPLPDEPTPSVTDQESARQVEGGNEPAWEGSGAAGHAGHRQPRAVQRAEDDEDQLQEARISWSHVLLLSYSSAITLALVWILWTGRSSRLATPTPPDPASPVVHSPARSDELELTEPPPPIPLENVARLGGTIQIGALEVTPLSVVAVRLELVRSIEPTASRREEDESLVLRLKLKNTSKFRTFTPLDAYLVRDRGLRPHDPYIATSEGSNIRLFALAVDSEWAIRGQAFPVLYPGDSVETIIAAEPGSGHRLAGEMTWRVRLRTGVYRTDMIGVRFTRSEVRHVEQLEDATQEFAP